MNLILTSTSGGLAAEEIEPFFHSLRLSGYDERVVVLASNISSECRALLKTYSADIVDFDYRGIPTLSRRSDRLRQGFRKVREYYRGHRSGEKEFAHLFFNNARFFRYRDYVLSLREKPDRILLADIRDIVFQAHPFSFPFQSGLSVASENTRRKIIHSRCALKGMFESVGLLETCRSLRRNIICAGTTVADHDTLLRYLELMVSGIKRRFFFALLEGIDQGLHTHCVHNRMIPPVHCYTNWNGPFLTLDSEVVLPKNKNREGFLCNEDGSVIPIVHQYDRVKELYRAGETRPECWKLYK
jgi:hypothetical protein